MISKELLRYPDQFVLYLSKQERDIEDIKRSMKRISITPAQGSGVPGPSGPPGPPGPQGPIAHRGLIQQCPGHRAYKAL